MALDAQKPWPADKVERWPLAKLVNYARNSRTHSPAQIEQVAASIREWGWTIPILAAEDGTIIAGHCRADAARKLGLTEVPVMIASGWSDAQKRAYVIADNKLTLNASWDQDMLVMELGDLFSEDFPAELTGFTTAEIDLLVHGPQGDPEDPDKSWNGMPEFDQKDKTAFRTLQVHFKDQQSVDDFARLVQQNITPHTKFLWYPHIEIETYADKQYSRVA